MTAPRLRVTPWNCRSEWCDARALVISRNPKALAMFAIWSCRTARLPAGVETTYGLLQAHLSLPHTCLSLATALNRFINHISHVAMALWDISILREAATRLSVPEWLVDLRHEATHGSMPGLTVLRAAVECGLAWLEVHYWKEEEILKNVYTEGGDRLSELLELYKYLKVYQVWGTSFVKEISDQEDMWDHLNVLWNDVDIDNELHKLSVKQAVNLVKSDINNIIQEEEDRGVERLIKCLVEDELMIADTEFLDSLENEESHKESLLVPKQLQKIWSEFVVTIDQSVGSVVLVDRLMEEVCSGQKESRWLAAAWVKLLVEGMLGRGSNLLNINSCRANEKYLGKWLEQPNPFIVHLVRLLCELSDLTDDKIKKVEHLVRLATNAPEVKSSKSIMPYTVSDIQMEEECGNEKEHVGGGSWQLDNTRNWKRMPLGSWVGQEWSDLCCLNSEWEDVDPSLLDEETIPHFVFDPPNWTTSMCGDSSKAHFYSDTSKQLQSTWKKRKLN